MLFATSRRRLQGAICGLAAAFLVTVSAPVSAQVTPFTQAVAEAAHGDAAVTAFYQQRNYEPIFTGKSDARRRNALLDALEHADAHGLPTARYDAETLKAAFKDAKTPRGQGLAEGMAARMFVQYAQDVQSGALTPHRVDAGIVREVPRRDHLQQLQAFGKSSPKAFLASLPPHTAQYNDLMAEKLRLEATLGKGGWGAAVPAKALKPGQQGPAVVALRNRLINMGYMKRSASATYDGKLQQAVQRFQINHGLVADGVAGDATIKAINVQAEARLASIIVAMERERWSNIPLGKRHILVNIPEFTAYIVDNGKVSFSTRVVVGKNQPDQRTPEFSDLMEFMIINPTWNVPRSIAIKEYLPMLQQNPNAAGHLQLVDSNGNAVSRGSVNFGQYTAANFPYRLKQPPSDGNALGQVKFMFPNPYNIYLHDTPSKNLFARDSRAFSHGCVRVADPMDFAYALLAPQTKDPQALFSSRLKGGAESRLDIVPPVPVHIDYRTAFAVAKSGMNYRDDIYGRDAKIWSALQDAGVKLRAAGS